MHNFNTRTPPPMQPPQLSGPSNSLNDASAKSSNVSPPPASLPLPPTSLVGSLIVVTTHTGVRHEGTLNDISHLGVSLRDAKDLVNPGAPLIPTYFIPALQIANWKRPDPTPAPTTNGSKALDSFRTDRDIGGSTALPRERELQAWKPDASTSQQAGQDALNKDSVTFGGNHTNGQWDQFAANEKLFGVKTDFHEEIYTTRLDRTTSDFRERERKAQQLADEITGTVSLNPHIREERGHADEGAANEEDKYGAVVRGPNAYIPPGARRQETPKGETPKPDGSTPKVTVNGTDGPSANGTTDAVNGVNGTNDKSSPSNKHEDAGVIASFRDFVTNEKQKLAQKKQAIAKSEMDKRLAELVKFSTNFKLNTPIPTDLVPILAKEPEKQKAIVDKSTKDAEDKKARAIGVPTNVPATVPPPAVPVAQPKPAASNRISVIQPIPPFRGGPAAKATATSNGATAVSKPSASVSPAPTSAAVSKTTSTPAKDGQTGTKRIPISMTIPKIPPFDPNKRRDPNASKPAANGNGTPSATSTTPASPTASVTPSKLNVNAVTFTPKPSAFKPGSTGTGPSTSPNPKPAEMTPNPYFGVRPINKRSVPIHIKDDFNPFKHNKVSDPATVRKRYMSVFPPPPAHQNPPAPHVPAPPSYEEDSAAQAAQAARLTGGYPAMMYYQPYPYPTGQPPQPHMMAAPNAAPPAGYMASPFMQPMPYPQGVPPGGAPIYAPPPMPGMPPTQAYMPPPPQGGYQPSGGPRASMPPTPIPQHAYAAYHQSPQMAHQHALPYQMMMPPPGPGPHGYDGQQQGPGPMGCEEGLGKEIDGVFRSQHRTFVLMADLILEVCVDSLESAKEAVSGGANRLEVCASLGHGGGTTPSLGLVRSIARHLEREKEKIPVMACREPSPLYLTGDFVYSSAEIDVMIEDIKVFKEEAGVRGVVFGALTALGSVDIEKTKRLVEAAKPLEVTFHRAFDMARGLGQAYVDIESVGGISRILSSGGASTVLEGLDVLQSLQIISFRARKARASSNDEDSTIPSAPLIMPGSGIRKETVGKIVKSLWPLGCREYHLSASSPVASVIGTALREEKGKIDMGGWSVLRTKSSEVKEVKAAAHLPSAPSKSPRLTGYHSSLRRLPKIIPPVSRTILVFAVPPARTLHCFLYHKLATTSSTAKAMKPVSESVMTEAVNRILEDITFQNRESSTQAPERSASDADIEFSAVDRQIELLLEALRGVEAHLQSRISQVKKRRNSLSIIHRLPIEILIEIFRSATHNLSVIDSNQDDPTGYYQALGALSAVCTFWSSIIDQAPKLWAVVSDNLDPRLLHKVINRSGDHPLSLLIEQWQEDYEAGSESLLKLLCSTAHRWEFAQFALPGENMHRVEAYLAGLSALKLKKLYIEAEVPYGGGPIDVLRGGVGNLEELDLFAVPMRWTSPLLSGLRILRLQHITGSNTAMTTSRLLTTLIGCPDLSELLINNFRFLESTAADDLPGCLNLPHLQILNLTDTFPSTAAYSIMSRISSLEYKYFRLIPGYEELPSGDVLQGISHHTPQLRRLMTSARRVSIELGPHNCQYHAYSTGDGPLLELDIDHASPVSVLTWITDALSGLPEGVKTKLAIARGASVSEEDVTTLCHKLPTITALCLLHAPTPFIHHLSTPTFINGKQYWALPKLASLIIREAAYEVEEILRLVEGRYGRHTQSNSMVGLPDRFLSLVVQGSGDIWDAGTCLKISEIVGQDHLGRNVFGIKRFVDPDIVEFDG
ncbi:hypothetical protein FRB99_001610 [Tulasnella sp. 403]|nr:hypothetical protein FRB99_001610 [Tulasnella sp. 403]